jgi:hypothetical protein
MNMYGTYISLSFNWAVESDVGRIGVRYLPSSMENE